MGVIMKQIKLVGSKGSSEVVATFDTGATYSFIRRDVAEQLETLLPLPQPMEFEMAQEGSKFTVSERVALDFWIDDLRFSDEFMVVDELIDSVLIGASTMQKWRMKLDMEREELILDPRVTRLRV